MRGWRACPTGWLPATTSFCGSPLPSTDARAQPARDQLRPRAAAVAARARTAGDPFRSDAAGRVRGGDPAGAGPLAAAGELLRRPRLLGRAGDGRLPGPARGTAVARAGDAPLPGRQHA